VTFLSATGCILHSWGEDEPAGEFLHFPDGMQQCFALNVGNMKYCEQERQPPQSIVAVRTAAIMELAILLRTVMVDDIKFATA